ncbi:MAG: HAMP domain-containing sensor histidine kinase [bacterium]
MATSLLILLNAPIFSMVVPLIGGFKAIDYSPALTVAVIAFVFGIYNFIKSILLEKVLKKRLRDLEILQEKHAQMMINISHELHTPLTIVKGELDLLSTGRLGKKVIQSFERSVDVIYKLTRDILYLAKLDFERGCQKQAVNFSQLLEESVEYFSTMTESKHVKLMAGIQPDIYVMGQADRLRELVANLAGNALANISNHREIKINLEIHGKTVLLAVEDAGVGIPEELLPNIFNRFHQPGSNAKKVKGTGLGLAVCKKIVDNHQGCISINSQQGKGTCVLVKLPVYKIKKPGRIKKWFKKHPVGK